MPATSDDLSVAGFAGTLQEFLDWVSRHLVYGHVHIGDPVESDRPWRGTVRRVEMVTAGYSDDEELLGRVQAGRGPALSLFSLSYWESSHRGGLFVYEIPTKDLDSDEEREWLQEATDVFETIARARTLNVNTSDGQRLSLEGQRLSLEVPTGVQLSFSEPKRDITSPAGVLTIEPYQPRYPL